MKENMWLGCVTLYFLEEAVCKGHNTRSNLRHTFRLSEVQGRIWMPLVVNVKLMSAATNTDQVKRAHSTYSIL